MEPEQKKEKQFAVRIDVALRKQIHSIAYKNGMLVKELVDRAFRLIVEAGGIEPLEKLFNDSKEQ